MRKVFYFLPLLFSFVLVHAQPGSVDATFNSTTWPQGRVITSTTTLDDEFWGMAIQSDGKIVAAGRTNYTVGGTGDFLVARFNYDGTYDNTFGANGIVTTNIGPGNDYAFAVQIQPDGKILVAGVGNVSGGDNGDNDFTVVRYTSTGGLDNTFGTGGIAMVDLGKGATTNTNDHCQAMALESSGKIILGGYRNAGTGDFAIVRLNSDGSKDLSFGGGDGMATIDISTATENGNGNEDFCAGVIIQSSGKYVLSGSTGGGVAYDFAIVRYNTDGTVDATFGPNGNGVAVNSIDEDDHAYSVTQQPDGKILQAGWTSTNISGSQSYDFAAVRYTVDGILDNTFGNYATGKSRVDVAGGNGSDKSRSIQVQSDGKLVMGGDANANFALLRLLSNGTVDGTFGTSGISTIDVDLNGGNDEGHILRLTTNRMYLAGYTRQSGSGNNLSIAAFLNDGSPLPLTLSQFTAQKQIGKVVLQWQTSMEENVNQFVIERSGDGKTYKAIGQVKATGNSNTTQYYSYADQSPSTSTSNYYRLLMQDADGNAKFSKVLIVKYDGQITANLQVFPSPVNTTLQVQLPAGLNGRTDLQIIDLNGRIIRNTRFTTDGNALSASLDVSSLQRGVYILKAQAENTTVTTRFTKQ